MEKEVPPSLHKTIAYPEARWPKYTLNDVNLGEKQNWWKFYLSRLLQGMMSSMQMAIVGWDEPRTDWKKDIEKLTKVEAHWRSKHFLFDTNVWPVVSAWVSKSYRLIVGFFTLSIRRPRARWEGREIWYIGQAGQIHGSKGLVDVGALRVGCDISLWWFSHAATTTGRIMTLVLKRMDPFSILRGLIKEDAVCIA